MKIRIAFLAISITSLLSISACAKSAAPLTSAELLDLGEKYLLEMDYEQASVQFLKAIEIDTMNPRCYIGAAEAYIALGKTDDAVSILQRGLSEIPNDANIKKLLDELLLPEPPSTTDDVNDVVDDVILFSDAVFERYVRKGLHKETGDIMRSDLEQITRLEIWGDLVWVNPDESTLTRIGRNFFSIGDEFYVDENGIEYSGLGSLQNINDIIYLNNLSHLTINFNKIDDYSALQQLPNLSYLRLCADQISDVSPFAGFMNLRGLELNWNNISNFEPLSALTGLETLALVNNQIQSLEPVVHLANLKNLYVTYNLIVSIAPVHNITGLLELDFGANQVNDISPLGGLASLRKLTISGNNLSNIEAISSLRNLEILYMSALDVDNFEPLKKLSKLSFLQLSHDVSDTDIQMLKSSFSNCEITKAQ